MPGKYLGKRIRLSVYIKSENVETKAGMWLRIDGKDENKPLGFDNMNNRRIKGTSDWTKYEIVLDVPDSSIGIGYGVLIHGNGEIWFSGLKIETVGTDIPTTNMTNDSPKLDKWFKAGSKPALYEIGKDNETLYDSLPCFYLKSISNVNEGFGTIMANIKPDEYLGKRIRLSGYIKSENIEMQAGMWMRIDGESKNKALGFDNMKNRPIKGTTDWTKYEIVLDVPDSSIGIAYGVLVERNGQILFPGLNIEVVSTDVPTTDMLKK